MLRTLFVVIVLLFSAFECDGAGADEIARKDHAQWIWGSAERSETAAVRFSKSFRTGGAVVSATLRLVGESAGISLSLDGNLVAVLEPYDPLATVDLTESLPGGDHELLVLAERVEGPSAFFLQLDIEYGGGKKQSIVTDASWSARDGSRQGDAISFGHVDPRLIIPPSRRVTVTAVDNYEQWKQALGTTEGTSPASFVVTPGFEIELVRSAGAEEGSWVSMEFDPQGRLIIAKESQGLLRMALSDDGSQVTNVELIEDTLKECRGLAFVDGDLFANANNDKGLYRLRRIDDDRFENPELLFLSPGGVGHGRNDLALGPDGMIYSIHGDAVNIPQDAIDYTSPFRDARRGKKTSEGHLLRIDPKSGAVEVLAAGLRNPFGIDFNADGDVFTYDADAEHDMGAPWYRPTRVSHLVTGGDYGWRGVTRSWPSYYPDQPDKARPNLDIGKGSPTAVKFAAGSHFPARYRDACFILDWAYGRIIAVHCLPRGSSYLLTAETFLKGRPLNVTDLGFAPDGSMYLVTGGRKTLSALYRVRFVGDDVKHETQSTAQQQARRSFANLSRKRRRALESELRQFGRSQDLSQHSRATRRSLDDAWLQTSDADPWIAQAATHLIQQYPVTMWTRKALDEEHPQRALRGLLSLARFGDAQLYSAIIGRLNELPIQPRTESEKLIALQGYSLCLTRTFVENHPGLVGQTRAKLGAMFPDASYLVNQSLSDLLVRVAAPDVVAKTIALLNSSSEQSEQMHYLYVLRGQREGWNIDDRKAYFTALAQSKNYVSGAGMPEFIQKIREEAIETLNQSERKSLAAIIDSGQPPSLSHDVKPRPLVRKWTVKELLAEKEAGRRDLGRGEEMFAAASCIQCHRVAGRGTLVGPDLTAASRRFSRQDLLTSIIEPSLVIAENYRSVQIVTTDGNTYVGQAVLGGDYRSPRLRLATDPSRPFKTIEIDKTAIEIQKASPISWMPSGLLDTLTRDEILDLLAYIDSAGSTSP